MSKLIITVILMTTTALCSAVGLIWALLQSEWLWMINYSILLVNTLLSALISVSVQVSTDEQVAVDSSHASNKQTEPQQLENQNEIL